MHNKDTQIQDGCHNHDLSYKHQEKNPRWLPQSRSSVFQGFNETKYLGENIQFVLGCEQYGTESKRETIQTVHSLITSRSLLTSTWWETLANKLRTLITQNLVCFSFSLCSYLFLRLLFCRRDESLKAETHEKWQYVNIKADIKKHSERSAPLSVYIELRSSL